jgi:hypothetical protein
MSYRPWTDSEDESPPVVPPPKRKGRAVKYLVAGVAFDVLMLAAGFVLAWLMASKNYNGRCVTGGYVFGGATYECTFQEYFRGEVLFGIMLWARYLWWAVAVVLILPPLLGLIVGLASRKS